MLPKLEVTLDYLVYLTDVDAPAERPHPFAYFLTIHNWSEQTVKVLGRKWVLNERGGECLVIEGQGVVGQTPTIVAGDSFSYNSCHVVASDTLVSGSYLAQCEDGTVGVIPIPGFELHVP